MDEKTQGRINELVAEFQKAKTPFDRQQITKTAQRDLQFVSGALREFVDRASVFGEVRLIGDVLGSYEQQQEQGTASSANADAVVDELLERYGKATTTSERNEVVLEATERLRGFPVQQNRFSFQIEQAGGVSLESSTLVPGEAAGTPAPTTTSPSPTTTLPSPSTGTTIAPSSTSSTSVAPPSSNQGPVTGTTVAPSATTVPASSAMPPSTTVPGASSNTTGTASADGTATGVPPVRDFATVIARTQLYAAMLSRGIPEETSRKLSDQYVATGKTLLEFQSKFDNLESQGYQRKGIIDSFIAESENVGYFPPPVQVPTYSAPRLVSIDGRTPEISGIPGIVDRNNGYELIRNDDGSLFFYDPDNAKTFLEELSVEERNELTNWFLDRGWIQDPFDSFGLIERTRQLLATANSEGRELSWVQDSLDELTGFKPENQYNRLTGPVVQQNRQELMRQVNDLASQQLGRALSRAEQMALVDSVYSKQLSNAREMFDAERRSAAGESATVEAMPSSLEEMTMQYLERTRPSEVKQAQDYSVMSELLDATLNGAFGEFIPLTSDFKFGPIND